MSELVKCATCKTEKPFSEMQTCMRAEREHSVCDMNCMIKLYKGEIKPDTVITPDLEEMVRLGMNPKEYHLHKENLELTEQLAKANERVRKLEQINLVLAANVEACCELTEMDMGAAIERLFEIDNTESKALLNKFAIEQKIEAIESFVLPYKQGVTKEYVKGGYGSLVLKSAQSEIEQLRKEQE